MLKKISVCFNNRKLVVYGIHQISIPPHSGVQRSGLSVVKQPLGLINRERPGKCKPDELVTGRLLFLPLKDLICINRIDISQLDNLIFEIGRASCMERV